MTGDGSGLPAVEVFSRPGCHLCEELIEQLLPIARDRFTIEVHNIEGREDWIQKYGTRIPVVQIAGKEICQYQLDIEAVTTALSAESRPNCAS